MNAVNAARVVVFAYAVVIPFVPPCQLSWALDPWARGAVLLAVCLLASLDLPLALLVALGYLETEIIVRARGVTNAARAAAVREYRPSLENAARTEGNVLLRSGDILPPKEAPQPFLTETNLRKAAEDDVVPGTDLFDGIRVGKGWYSAQGFGDDDNLLPASA